MGKTGLQNNTLFFLVNTDPVLLSILLHEFWMAINPDQPPINREIEAQKQKKQI
jgi:hypothetical protein